MNDMSLDTPGAAPTMDVRTGFFTLLKKEVLPSSVADAVYAAGEFGLARWSGQAWTVEVPIAALGAGYHDLKDVCATDHHFVAADASGGALTRPR